jgi:hypothetical protein
MISLEARSFNSVATFALHSRLYRRHATHLSDDVIVKNISPIEILHLTKFVPNLTLYKKDSTHFYVGLTQISVI